jgi:CMP/dCMP kinase
MEKKKITIAVDGFSSCGKSTLARQLAKELAYQYIDSGSMYRAVTLFALRQNLLIEGNIDKQKLIKQLDNISVRFHFNEVEQKSETYLNGENVEAEIRGLGVAAYVSQVAAIPEVRTEMVKIQRQMGSHGGVVMDGRDIGTVVFPHAELKIFMTASPEIRAQRRFDELIQKGEDVQFDEVLKNINGRDHIDQNRDVSPLAKAQEAFLLDNSYLNQREQLKIVLQKVKDLENGN